MCYNKYVSTFHIIVSPSLFQVPKSCSKSISFEEPTLLWIVLICFDMFHEHTDSASYELGKVIFGGVAYETTLSIFVHSFLGARLMGGRSHSSHNIVALTAQHIYI